MAFDETGKQVSDMGVDYICYCLVDSALVRNRRHGQLVSVASRLAANVSASHRYTARRGYDRLAPPTIRMKGQLCVLYRQQSLANRIDPQRKSLWQVTSNGYARLLAQLAPVLGGASYVRGVGRVS
jgi:hypothetical protein